MSLLLEHADCRFFARQFLYSNVLFKLSRNDKGLFASDECAAKMSAAELRGLAHILGAGVAGVHLPLECVLDHKGAELQIAFVESCLYRLSLDGCVAAADWRLANAGEWLERRRPHNSQ